MACYFIPCPHCGAENKLLLGVDWRPIPCQVCNLIMGPKPDNHAATLPEPHHAANRGRGKAIGGILITLCTLFLLVWHPIIRNDVSNEQRTEVRQPQTESVTSDPTRITLPVQPTVIKQKNLPSNITGLASTTGLATTAAEVTSTTAEVASTTGLASTTRLASTQDATNHSAMVISFPTTGDVNTTLQTLHKLLEQFPDPEKMRVIQNQIQTIVATHTKSLEILGDWAQLAHFFQELITLNPKYPPYAFKLAQAQMALGQYQEVMESLRPWQYDAVWRDHADKIIREAAKKKDRLTQGDTRIPLIPHGDGFLLDVTLNQHVTARLMLDTGASMTILTPVILAKLNLAHVSSESIKKIQTANGRIDVPTVLLDTLSVQNRSIPAFRVGVIQETEFSGFDGLLGMDFFMHYQFMLDPAEQTLLLSDKR